MSALRMCAYGVLILPRLRDANGLPLRQPLGNVLTERAKIIDAVQEELETEAPGWSLAPHYTGRYGLEKWRRGSTSTRWHTERFSVWPPIRPSGFGELQPHLPHAFNLSWQVACLVILRIIEPDNTAWA